METILENTGRSSVSPEEEFKRGLKKAFDRMDREIRLILFTERAKEDVFVQAARQIQRRVGFLLADIDFVVANAPSLPVA